MFRILALCSILLIAVPNAFAWGEAGHLMSNEAATLTLPNDMPSFFYRAFPQLVWFGPQPDRLLHTGGPSFDAEDAPDHFLNYEMVEGLELTPDRYQYLAALISSGRYAHLGVSLSTPGFSPWRIAEMSDRLTGLFREWRASAPRSAERLAIEHDIVVTAGSLGHFVADSANPLHDTTDYNGWLRANPNGYANDCLIHARFESDFVARAVNVADIVPKVAAPVLRSDYFNAALDFIKRSNTLVERVYQLDKKGDFDEIARPSAEGKEFAADRLAAGASLLRDLWWSAWKNSETTLQRRRGPASATTK